MALMKYAKASIVHPHISRDAWATVRTASGSKAPGNLSGNLIERAAEFFGGPFDINKYLLSHCTIVSSVDVYAPEGVRLGKQMGESGKRIDIRYPKYRVTANTAKYINNNCFPPGTPITMGDGTLKPIEQVQVGDAVLTHLGRVRRVSHTFVQPFAGSLVEIKHCASNERTYVTENHPFFVFRPQSECVYCGKRVHRNHRCITNLLGKFYCSKECYYQHKVPNAVLLQDKVGEFVSAGELTNRDFVCSPVLTKVQDVDITLGKARLLGYFLAEGSFEGAGHGKPEHVGVQWSFHSDERNTLAQTVIDLMQSEFGVDCVIRELRDVKGIVVTTRTNRDVVPFFKHWIHGDGATTKTLNGDLLFAQLPVQRELLQGWFEGDGSSFDTRREDVPGDVRLAGSTSSQSLASQIRIILSRLGVGCHVTHAVNEGRKRLIVDGLPKIISDPTKECHSWMISVGDVWMGDMVEGTVYEQSYIRSVALRGGLQKAPKYRFLNGNCLQMVEKTDRVDFEGVVYNFEVEEDHSYLVNGIAVHNCDFWPREVLLKSYPTFIGAHSFCEHVQIEDLSKGRIIDAVARDIGDSVYIDILIANDKKHKELISAIESGKMSTLSMGCFPPGTQVTMADGRRIAIEDVVPGDMVLTHKGRVREVLNKQVRGGKWGMRTVHAVGLASPIISTDNHPYYVLRPAEVCACGCGESLPAYAPSVRKPTTRSLTRKFKVGHDKRILNPNSTYSIEDFKRRKAQMNEIQNPELVRVRADELRVGDYIAFPRMKDGETTVEMTVGKARLLGYFLAEGSFLKYQGKHCEVQFNFSLEEKDTFVTEVVQLLEQEFPEVNMPWVQDRRDRTTCTVHVTGADIVAWFLQHGGEYSHGKRLSADAMNWSMENHKHLIGAWLNGDGHRAKAHGGFLVGTTVSLDLASQMHALMAKCGWFARFDARIGAKSVTVAEAVNGGVAVRDEATGRLPAYLLTIGNTQSVELQGYCAKAPTSSKYRVQNNRIFEDWVVSPITSIEESTYEGAVHNMEVAEDHTYLAEGASVGNCTIDGSQCTKCGHWAADETEMCNCVKYQKGNTFFDEQGRSHIVAEKCGDEVLDPTGGVTFIEASWVESPAFTGAVKRNILTPNAETARRAYEILSSTPPEWSDDLQRKAASVELEPQEAVVVGKVADRRKKRIQQVKATMDLSPMSTDEFLAGWMDEDTEDAPAEEEAPAEYAPAEDAPAEDAKSEDPLKGIEDELAQYMTDRLKKRFKEQMTPSQGDASGMAPNDNLVKQAAATRRIYLAGLKIALDSSRSDIELMDRVARLNQTAGVAIPRALYLAALVVGPMDQYSSNKKFKSACKQALQRNIDDQEMVAMRRLSLLLNQQAVASKRSAK